MCAFRRASAPRFRACKVLPHMSWLSQLQRRACRFHPKHRRSFRSAIEDQVYLPMGVLLRVGAVEAVVGLVRAVQRPQAPARLPRSTGGELGEWRVARRKRKGRGQARVGTRV